MRRMRDLVLGFVGYLTNIVVSCAIAGVVILVGISLLNAIDRAIHSLHRKLSGR